MCETKAAVVSISIFLLAPASFCTYQAHAENTLEHNSKIKSQGPRENEYKKFGLNGGECYYIVDEYFVRCNCTWLYGGKRCKNYMWWDKVRTTG